MQLILFIINLHHLRLMGHNNWVEFRPLSFASSNYQALQTRQLQFHSGKTHNATNNDQHHRQLHMQNYHNMDIFGLATPPLRRGNSYNNLFYPGQVKISENKFNPTKYTKTLLQKK
jgi:tryptophan 2,3-dioxygenase